MQTNIKSFIKNGEFTDADTEILHKILDSISKLGLNFMKNRIAHSEIYKLQVIPLVDEFEKHGIKNGITLLRWDK